MTSRGFVAISTRVDILEEYEERRDALDHRWTEFFDACDIVPILVPNDPAVARKIVLRARPQGIVLSGGNDLVKLGGNAPERDSTERTLLEFALSHKVPILGVCRGAQFIIDSFGGALRPVRNHVRNNHFIEFEGHKILVNSFHRFGASELPEELVVSARSEDGIVEAFAHGTKKVAGIMWHPERVHPFSYHDILWFKDFFGVVKDEES